MKNIRLGIKLIGGFLVVALILAIVGGLGYRASNKLNASISEIGKVRLPSVEGLYMIYQAQTEIDSAENALLVRTLSKKAREEQFARFDAAKKRADEGRKIYEPLPQTKEEEAVWKQFAPAWDAWWKDHERYVELAHKYWDAPSDAAYEAMVHQALVTNGVTFGKAEEHLLKTIKINVEVGNAEAETSDKLGDFYELWSLILAVVGVLLAVGLGWILTRGITRPLAGTVAFAEAVQGGRLDEKLAVEQKDEIGVLADCLRGMVESLKQKISEADQKSKLAEEESAKAHVATGEATEAKARAERAKAEGMLAAAGKLEGVVEIVTSASEELSAQIEQSSRGAESQSHRVAETATAMEEMTATVVEVAGNASRAAETSDSAKAKATDGAALVGQMVAGIGEVQTQALGMKEDMGVLGRQADGIGQIMNVISDIADQTNLLALNAAIEAARAGDAGRGFAVVADEVRKLAEKTMTATKEVGEAIRGIQSGTTKNIQNVERTAKTIAEATALAQRAGEALNEIVHLVDLASDQVRAIATASEQQSAASEEISHSIEEVNTISSETSQAMNQAAQAVGELANQSLVLKGLISELKSEGAKA